MRDGCCCSLRCVATRKTVVYMDESNTSIQIGHLLENRRPSSLTDGKMLRYPEEAGS
jgi:hypothetical protein